MKKLATLLLAAGLVFGAATGASAIDFKAKGQWIMSFDYGAGMQGASSTRSGGDIYGSGRGDDMFEANQRVRLQLDAVASESLSGTVYFEMGDTTWGSNASGGALGADGKIVEVKRAYLDWIVPNTDLKVRMGIQGLALPAFTTGASQIFDEDVAGIALSNKFNDNVAMTFFWARPYNDNFVGQGAGWGMSSDSNFMDNVDMFGLLLPLSFDGVKVTPWVMYTAVGPNALNGTGIDAKGKLLNPGIAGNSTGAVVNGMLPAAFANRFGSNKINEYGSMFHAGLTGEVTMWDPFRLAWDLNYGGVSYGDMDQYNRSGFYGSLLAEYKMDWGTPGIYGWYSTGDDGDVKNGSESMVSVRANGNNQFSNFAGNGNPYIAREGVLGTTLIGTWGLGARVKDVSFLEGLKHTFRVNYFQGTNDTGMAGYITGRKYQTANGRTIGRVDSNFNATPEGAGKGMYLTTADSAMEFGLTTQYKIYDNLEFMLDMAYLALWMDQSRDVWGNGFTATDAWNINASFVYSF